MKQIFVMSAIVLAMSASVANAGIDKQGTDSETLTVTASIAAPTCTFDMNSSKDMAFGTITSSILSLEHVTKGENMIASIPGAFSVACDAKTLVRMQVADTYAQTLRDGKHGVLFYNDYGPDAQFALVDGSNNSKLIGSYIIKPTSIKTVIGSNAAETKNLYVEKGAHTAVIRSTKNNSIEQETLVIGSGNGFYANTLNVDFTIEPQFLPRKDWHDAGTEVEILGEATFSMVYL